jgi:hypothetical protein
MKVRCQLAKDYSSLSL